MVTPCPLCNQPTGVTTRRFPTGATHSYCAIAFAEEGQFQCGVCHGPISAEELVRHQEAAERCVRESAEEESYCHLCYSPLHPDGHYVRVFMDGDQWCVLMGSNIQEGIAGFGSTVAEAFAEFGKAWEAAGKEPR